MHLLEGHYRKDFKSKLQEQDAYVLGFTTETWGVIQIYILTLKIYFILLYQKLIQSQRYNWFESYKTAKIFNQLIFNMQWLFLLILITITLTSF